MLQKFYHDFDYIPYPKPLLQLMINDIHAGKQFHPRNSNILINYVHYVQHM